MKIIKAPNFFLIESFLKTHFSSPTHWPEWNLAISRFFKTDFFYLCAYKDQEMVGLCPIHRNKKGLLNFYHSGQFHYIPYGGWLFSETVKFKEEKMPFKFLSCLQSFNLPLVSEFDLNIHKKYYKEYKTLVIDLQKSCDDIWKEEIDVKRRNMIRKAEKNGIVVQVCNQVNEFYKLYEQVHNRLGLNPYPKELVENLFCNSINVHFEILNAKISGEILANVVIAYDKNYSLYWLGNNADNVANLGQGELLQWEAIKRMKENGCHYYDLCYIDKDRLPGIYRFKSGFSKNEMTVPYMNYKPFPFKFINKISKWF